jgi:hypothetical protein
MLHKVMDLRGCCCIEAEIRKRPSSQSEVYGQLLSLQELYRQTSDRMLLKNASKSVLL